jgi:uncharacterized Zn-binding protein involved in type VI secretion
MPLAAKKGDSIVAFDTHLILPVPQPAPAVPVPMHPFSGVIDRNLSGDVSIEGRAAATVGSTATNTPRHLPLGGTFVKEPTNQGEIVLGSTSVTINGKKAARLGDTAKTCNDPVDLPVGTVVVKAGTVSVGG